VEKKEEEEEEMQRVVVLLLCLAGIALANSWAAEKTTAEVKQLLGWKKNPDMVLPILEHPATAIPDSFDSRTQWPNCSTIGAIQNQARCGSCWAFGAVESITDRFCIHNGVTNQLSFEDLVSCDIFDRGCDGGDAASAWHFAEWFGLVSAECAPYTVPTCPPDQQPCLDFVPTPKCPHSCANDSMKWDDDKSHVQKPYTVSANNNGIETEIMTNGPVEACFEVYSDFVNYTSGVYQHKSGDYLGGHCVKLVGWGVDTNSSLPYWLVANSWTTYWGNEGFFWILRGNDECGIESDVVAGIPRPN
jgi:cathepsin B